MKLLLSTASPYARKVWVMLHEKGLADRTELIRVAAIEDPEALLAANPVGLVPTLVRDDGESLYDSIVITEYLDYLGGPRFYPQAGEARWQALRAQALCDGMLDAAVDTVLDRRRPNAEQSPSWQARLADRIERLLAEMERQIAGLPADADGLAQLFFPCALDYLLFREIVPDWRPAHPRLADWFAAAIARESLRATDPRLHA